MSSRLKWYVAVVCAAALITLASLAPRIDVSRLREAWPIIAIFGVLLALGEFLPIRIRHRNQTKLITVTNTFALAMLPVAGVALTALVYVTTSIVAELIHRRALVKIAFN